jgi:hypothetical protein
MSTLLFESYVFLGESLFYFAHLPPGSSNPAMANEHIIHVAVWWPKRVYLSHPQEFSARQNLTTQQKAKYDTRASPRWWCLLQHSIDHRGRRRVSIIWWMWLVMSECSVVYAAYMGFWIRSLVAAHSSSFISAFFISASYHYTTLFLSSPIPGLSYDVYSYIMPNKTITSRFRPNPTRSVPPLVANILLGAQGVSVQGLAKRTAIDARIPPSGGYAITRHGEENEYGEHTKCHHQCLSCAQAVLCPKSEWDQRFCTRVYVGTRRTRIVLPGGQNSQKCPP